MATRAKRSGSAGLAGRVAAIARSSKTGSVSDGRDRVARIRSHARSREVVERDKGDSSSGIG